jgi:hypothetical protein
MTDAHKFFPTSVDSCVFVQANKLHILQLGVFSAESYLLESFCIGI